MLNKNIITLTSNILFIHRPGDVFDELTELTELDLSYNQISTIQTETFKLTRKLSRLDLSSNRLTYIFKAVFIHAHNPYPEDPADKRLLSYLNLADNPLKCVPYWMEGPNSRWYRRIQHYTKVYKPDSIGYCTLCPLGQYAASFANEGYDCQPCPVGGICRYDHDENYGTFSWTIEWCDPGDFVEEGKGKSLTDCEPCPPGHYCPGEGAIYACYKVGEVCEGGCDDKCYVCNEGQFANHDHTKCLLCPKGTYGKDGFSCHPCPPGSYGNTPGYTNESCAGLCDLGHYCPSGSKSSTEIPCPAGTYGDERGLFNSHCSGLCEIGAYCPEGSISSEGIPCAAGRYGSLPGQKNAQCSGPCSPEHWCPSGSVLPTNVKCGPRDISRVGDTHCYECAPDAYNTQREPKCTYCDGKRSWQAAITPKDNLDACPGCPLGTYNYTVNPGSIWSISECRECAPGYWNDRRGSFSIHDCKPCPVNTYSDQPGLTSKYLCEECPLGTFSNVTAATDISVCMHCPAGTFFAEGVETNLARSMDVMCRPCKAGSWSSGNDGICHLCETGYWSDEIGRKYPCHQVCDPRYLCPAGSTHPKMFILAQGNELPTLSTQFWSFLFSCLSGSIILLLFRFSP